MQEAWKSLSHPNKEKAEWTEKSSTFLGSTREVRTWEKTAASKLSHSLPYWSRDTSGNLHRNQGQGRKTQTVLEEPLHTQCGQL